MRVTQQPAWANYADALRKISLAWRSSRTSCSNALIRSRSAVVAPSRKPALRSCWRTQRRRVFESQPGFAATAQIVAHRDSCSLRCSKTLRTTRSRTSGENFVVFFRAPSSQESEPP